MKGLCRARGDGFKQRKKREKKGKKEKEAKRRPSTLDRPTC